MPFQHICFYQTVIFLIPPKILKLKHVLRTLCTFHLANKFVKTERSTKSNVKMRKTSFERI